jgi:cell division protein FtsL
MSRQQVNSIKPFLSVLLMMCFLFSIAFIKMENRRLGYSYMQLAGQEKEMRNQQREKAVELARITGPERVQYLATQRLPMKKAQEGQIIQMTGDGLAFVQ